MKNRILLTLMCITVPLVPLAIAVNYELTMRYGSVHELKLYPVDPYSPFSGRYLQLNYGELFRAVPFTKGINPRRGRVYVVMERAGDVSRPALVTDVRPAAGDFFIASEWTPYENGVASVEVPFDRFYENEARAKAAEQLLQNAIRDGGDVRVRIRMRGGAVAVESIILNGREAF